MRGKLAVCRGDSVFNGITPAYAGKTAALRALLASEEDHPRVCGENFRAGGKAQCPAWITPAYAGKTWDCCQTNGALGGSPPRMRGKLMR